ncbi:MAG: DNA polymerase III subunit beta [Sorangiineae bacterium]|nr:DNA polymerase III subunit beta [Polyangiaceae bacterium]MEB2322386.1 DNA polymerase III subunit beta [Sorangiineae bacterium]
MHVVVAKKDLLRLLTRCQAVADKKSTMPALSNVLLEVAGPDQLRLAATDLLLAVSGKIRAEVDKGGSVAIGARDLLERVRMMPDGQVSIATGEGSATIVRAVGSARRYTLHGTPGEDFPALPQPDASAPVLSLDVATLARLIGSTMFSISPEDTRLQMNSALFEWDGDRVRMVTTDGHRLSKMDVSLPARQATATMLIPLRGVQELKRLCDEAASDVGTETPIEMIQSGPNAFFRLAGLEFSVKLVDAQFPAYQQVIPETSGRAIRAPRLAMADALRAVSLAASDRTGGVKLTLGGNKMRFESESPESGAGFDEVDIEYSSEELTVGFNARYFLDVLGALDDDEVVLGVSGELDPAVIRPGTESTERSYLAVIMPMRI